jgi:hypothetical protein
LGSLARDGKRLPKDEAVAYRWFTIASIQAGSVAENYLKADLLLARQTLGADELGSEEQAARKWMMEHPRKDIFLFSENQEDSNTLMTAVPATGLDTMKGQTQTDSFRR